MNVHVTFSPSSLGSEHDLRRSTVVVVDTLRATSTIVTALMAGAREVVVAATIEEAVAIAHRLGTERTLLAGERGGMRISGFTLGNSPAEYTPEVVHGKTIVLTTSNGSATLLKARYAARTYCGALLNAEAVARRIAEDAPKDLLLLCAGSNGDFALEDVLGAGAILNALDTLAVTTALVPSDAARVAHGLFRELSGSLHSALASCDHGRALSGLGFADDIGYCARLNIDGAPVPTFVGSSIKVYQESGSASATARFA